MVARLGCGVSGMLHPVTRARPLEQNRRSWGPGGARLPWQIFSRRCPAAWGRQPAVIVMISKASMAELGTLSARPAFFQQARKEDFD